jgi:hypothetical protein
MPLQSRRRFIQSCAAVGGVGSLACMAAGCRRGESVMTDVQPMAKDATNHSETGRSAGLGEEEQVFDPDAPYEPGYVKLHRKGELKKRADALWSRMSPCKLCPRSCGVDRLEGEKGFCQSPSQLVISSFHPHYGEEPPLVGRGGSGTIFFTHCALRCVFCINHEISMGGEGASATIEQLAQMMLRLQARGCHNINVVTPTHYSPHILMALDIAAGQGLNVPLVYNTCGWEQMEILRIPGRRRGHLSSRFQVRLRRDGGYLFDLRSRRSSIPGIRGWCALLGHGHLPRFDQDGALGDAAASRRGSARR